MLELEQVENLIKLLQGIKTDIKRRQRLLEKECNTPNQHQKRGVDLSWSAMELEKSEFLLHTLVVQAGIANPFNDDYYGVMYFQPSAFHKYPFNKKHPIKDN
ncbi:hypothetical protein EOL99_03260 [Candidatus Falkowbacteria bacterium]|nr:hypothetical protein [Candidatus Falkowbacteria bacterium]